MKQKTWDDPNKMHIETGHKTFDKQTAYITCGGAICSTQVSSYIRPMTCTINPVGQKVEYGYLTDYDINQFKNFGITTTIIKEVKKYAENKSVILYCFFHMSGNRKIIHGFVLSDAHYNLIKYWSYNRYKDNDIIQECIKYVTN